MGALSQNRNREIVEQIIQLFKEKVMTKLSHFRECEYFPNQSMYFSQPLNWQVSYCQENMEVQLRFATL